jgi:hypothetical protein
MLREQGIVLLSEKKLSTEAQSIYQLLIASLMVCWQWSQCTEENEKYHKNNRKVFVTDLMGWMKMENTEQMRIHEMKTW